MIEGAFPGACVARSQDDREELSLGERFGSLVEKLFPRPVLLGPVLDRLIPRHKTRR